MLLFMSRNVVQVSGITEYSITSIYLLLGPFHMEMPVYLVNFVRSRQYYIIIYQYYMSGGGYAFKAVC